jgi:ribonuclease D
MTCSPRPGKGLYITTAEALGDLCRRLRQADRLALDTEFVSEQTYVPQLGLIQVAGNGLLAMVDPLAVPSLDPLIELLRDPTLEKVVHAGRQELEIFCAYGYGLPQPIFDVQIAAAFLGYGDQVSYASLVQELIGHRLQKKETFTDWLQRPLRRAQVEYALEDVEYLLPVAEKLREQLVARGRLGWAQEEFAKLVAQVRWPRVEAGQEYQLVAGWSRLDRRSLAVLRELAAWREREAQQRNWPRRRVLSDTLLLELARRHPTHPRDLRDIRALPRRIVEKSASEVIMAIQRGLQTPDSDLPRRPRKPPSGPSQAAVADLLAALIKMRALEMGIAPRLLATQQDLEDLIQQFHNGQEASLPLFQGWRGEAVGADLLAFLNGATALRLNPATGQVRTEPAGEG